MKEKHFPPSTADPQSGALAEQTPFLPWLDEIEPYVPGKPPEHVLRKLGGRTLLRMASNENPLGPSPAVIELLRGEDLELNRYPDDQAQALKNTLSEVFGVPVGQIAVGNGSNDLIDQLVRITSAPGREVIMSEASFPTCRISALAAGARLTLVPQREDRHDLPAMAAAIGPETRLVYVCNPNNPTATMNTAAEVDRFLEAVPSHVLPVFDEAYFEYIDTPDFPDLLPRVLNRENLVLLRTFSKCYSLANLRIGYGFCPRAVTQRLEKVRLPFNANGVAQRAAMVSILDQEQVIRSREFNTTGRAFLSAAFEGMGVEYRASFANFLMVRIPFPPGNLYNELLGRGVVVRPLSSFGLSPDHYRVTIGTREQNQAFLHTLQDVLAS